MHHSPHPEWFLGSLGMLCGFNDNVMNQTRCTFCGCVKTSKPVQTYFIRVAELHEEFSDLLPLC